MILEANQRGGDRQLANHLSNTKDNEHVTIHEIKGLVADNLHDALREIYIASKMTKCQQYLFSVSMNPPKDVNAPIEYFERAIRDIEKKHGLEGQPRVVVFHEKEGRRHAHCVWSRIDIENRKAINLPHYKLKLKDLSKSYYLEYGWQLPQGYIKQDYADPLNFTRAEWEQAKRIQSDPRVLKELFRQAWEISDGKAAFEHALKDYGFYLAKGDRRGYVALDYHGNVYSLTRFTGQKTKALEAKLGDPEKLLSVDQTKADIAKRMTQVLKNHEQEAIKAAKVELDDYKRAAQTMRDHHKRQRQLLAEKHAKREEQEIKLRQDRLPKRLKGFWYRITGKYRKICKQNKQELTTCQIRDRDEKQALIVSQLTERRKLQEQIQNLKQVYEQDRLSIRQDIAKYMEMGGIDDRDLLNKHHNLTHYRSGPDYE
jgi:hypothetical protein